MKTLPLVSHRARLRGSYAPSPYPRPGHDFRLARGGLATRGTPDCSLSPRDVRDIHAEGYRAMKLWILSDLHVEQSRWDLPNPPPDHDVLIAAGDIHSPLTEGVRWLAARAGGKPVIYVPGNHEWYTTYRRRFTIEDEATRAASVAADTLVQLMIDRTVVIAGVRIIGATLWTNFSLDGDIEAAMAFAGDQMNDYFKCYKGDMPNLLQPTDTAAWHARSVAFIQGELAKAFDGPTVIVTHHAPHPRSIHPKYAGNRINPAFSSNLSTFVERSGVALWCHGHMHNSFDYIAGSTRIICNPKGYGPRTPAGRIENAAFNAHLVVEI
ncbi:metallophosphoesterase [Novosphingobium panipatense]